MIDSELARLRVLEDVLPADEVAYRYIALAEQRPGEPRIWQSLALFLIRGEDFAAAIEAIDLALAWKKDPLSYFIKGRVLDEMMDFAGSIACYRQCLRRDRDNARAKLYLSLACLSLGDFENGTRLYPHRLTREQTGRFTGMRRWSPAGRSGRVFVWAEQGIGDEIMFLQLLRLAAPLDFAFTVECDRRLVSLLQANFPGMRFVARGGPIDRRDYEYHIAMGDLLALFHQPLLEGALERPAIVPILRADVATRAAQVKAGRKLIGLSWLSANEEYGARRSVPVETLCRALDPARHAIAILQYLAQEEDLARLRARGFQCVADVDGFNDIEATFALIAACDAIVSIDNSVAHFAGAVGVETHLLLPSLPNWRWGTSGTASYWYPALRLHRRAPGLRWEDVVDGIALG